MHRTDTASGSPTPPPTEAPLDPPAESVAIRAALAETGRTQTDLGGVLELSQQAVSRRMTGEVEWSANELRAVARFLDVPAATLLEATR